MIGIGTRFGFKFIMNAWNMIKVVFSSCCEVLSLDTPPSCFCLLWLGRGLMMSACWSKILSSVSSHFMNMFIQIWILDGYLSKPPILRCNNVKQFFSFDCLKNCIWICFMSRRHKYGNRKTFIILCRSKPQDGFV